MSNVGNSQNPTSPTPRLAKSIPPVQERSIEQGKPSAATQLDPKKVLDWLRSGRNNKPGGFRL
jgi:hypothetical protein